MSHHWRHQGKLHSVFVLHLFSICYVNSDCLIGSRLCLLVLPVKYSFRKLLRLDPIKCGVSLLRRFVNESFNFSSSEFLPSVIHQGQLGSPVVGVVVSVIDQVLWLIPNLVQYELCSVPTHIFNGIHRVENLCHLLWFFLLC